MNNQRTAQEVRAKNKCLPVRSHGHLTVLPAGKLYISVLSAVKGVPLSLTAGEPQKNSQLPAKRLSACGSFNFWYAYGVTLS